MRRAAENRGGWKNYYTRGKRARQNALAIDRRETAATGSNICIRGINVIIGIVGQTYVTMTAVWHVRDY